MVKNKSFDLAKCYFSIYNFSFTSEQVTVIRWNDKVD